MKLRGEEVLLATSTVGAYPRPHWIQGRTFGTLREPVYRSYNARVSFEDASKLCARDQEEAGLDLLTDGHQYYEWEAPGYQLEPIFHFVTENLEGFEPWGPPGAGEKYKFFYQALVTGKIKWKRPIFEGVVNAMKGATKKPFKFSFLGPAQNSVIVNDRDKVYKDNVALAMDMAEAFNQELKYLVNMGLEAVQLIDVLPPYTQEKWQIEVQRKMFDGVNAIKLWHVCYGSVDGQTDVFENKARDMMALFHESPADNIHLEFSNRNFAEIESFREFPRSKVLGIGVIDCKNMQIEKPETVAERIRTALKVMPAERLMVSTDCGLGYFSRTVAFAKLKAMVEGTRIVRKELTGRR